MWVAREVYERLIRRESELEARCAELVRTQAAAYMMNEWLRVRTEQVERERAMLLERYTGVKVEVPSVRTLASFEQAGADLSGAQIFDDMGDNVAKAAGIEWNDDGTIRVTR